MNTNDLKLRVKSFALRIIRLVDSLPKTVSGRAIANQIIRSGTSVAANYNSTLRSRSKAEFISKINIVIEECDETLLWLDLIADSGLIKEKLLADIRKEANELLSIFCATQKTMKNQKSEIRNQK